jgi:hypothetical protein
MRRFFIFFFLILFNISSHASPLNWMFKTYFGVTYSPFRSELGGEIFKERNQFFNAITKLENIQLMAGLRIHRNFSAELSYVKFNDIVKDTSGRMIFSANIIGLDVVFYLPLTPRSLEMIGTSFELLGGVGAHLMMLGQGYGNIVVPKYMAGVQLRALDSFAVRLSYDLYHMSVASSKMPNNINMLGALKVGVFYFF